MRPEEERDERRRRRSESLEVRQLALLASLLLLATASARAEESPAPSSAAQGSLTTEGALLLSVTSPEAAIARIEVRWRNQDDESLKRKRFRRHVPEGESSLTLPLDPGAKQAAFDLTLESPRYRFQNDMGRFGRGRGQFIRPRGIALGPRGDLYVADTGNDRIQVLDSRGRYLLEFGRFSTGSMGQGSEVDEAGFDEPWDLTLSSGNELYISDMNNDRIVRYDLLGRFISAFGEDEGLRIPMGVASDPQREIYVCDSDNDRVLVFSSTGRLLRRIGSYGWGNQQMQRPVDAAVDSEGTLYVADSGNRRVHVYDRYQHLKGYLKGPFEVPASLSVGPDDLLHVVDRETGRVHSFTNRLDSIRIWPEDSDRERRLRATDLAISSDGTMYVLDGRASKIHVLKNEPVVRTISGESD